MGTYINSPVIIGDNNNVSVHSSLENVHWEEIKDDCISVLQQLPKGSKEREATEQMFSDAIQKDKGKLRNTIKKYAKELTSELFTGTASTFLVELIKNVLQ